MLCVNNHPMQAGDKFCAVCGQSAAVAQGPITPPTNEEVSATTQISKSPKKGLLIGGAILAALAGVVFISGNSAQPKDVNFSLTVFNDSGCDLGLGYFNVPGMDIDVYVDGDYVTTESLPSYGQSGGLYCEFETVISDIPTNGERYRFDTDSRGDLNYTKSEMEDMNWSISVSLGD